MDGKAAYATCRYPSGQNLARTTSALAENAYFTYPHANGFADDASCILARAAANGSSDYLKCDLQTGSLQPIARVKGARLYYAISRNQQMVVALRNGAMIVDLQTGAKRQVFECPEWQLLADCDIHPDGAKILVNRYLNGPSGGFRIDIVDAATGRIEPVIESDHPLDHAHFSPFNPDWVCFADGSPHALHRTWIWHRTKAPNGRPIFNQLCASGRRLDVGHERCMFDKASLLTIAYADSSCVSRGLYEVDFDGTVRLVSQSNSDSHCNVSRDGRWAVVSSLTPIDLSSDSIDFCRRTPADWTRSDKDYVISDISVVNLRSGARRFLCHASNEVSKGKSLQPWEAQPAISPSGRWVLVKDAKIKRVLAVEVDQKALQHFLS